MDLGDSPGSVISEPRPEMEFDTHEDAYLFYKEYAKSVGFGTAKLSSRRSRASKEFIDAKFSCIRYGSKQQSDDAINPRPSPKIGCKASMHVKRRPNGRWYVYSFVKDHNHELLPDQAHFFRSHRNTDPLKSDARFRRKKNVSAVSKLFSAYQNLDFLDCYARNQHDKGRHLVLQSGDAQYLLEFFMCMQEENPKFFYAIDFSEDHRLRNVFWVDAKGVEDYRSCSDVVSFDTTYFVNKYEVPLVLFVGVNHHVQQVLLGCGLIADDTVYTYAWLMQTWLMAMNDQAPKVMLTDQNNSIKAAVAALFPETRHCFCLWYVLERLPRNLDYWSLWEDAFTKKFYKCIYRSWTEEEFERRWLKLLEKFHLREVQWMRSLYEERKYWAPTFMKGITFAGLSTPHRSESLNSVFDRYIKDDSSLRGILGQYKLILEDMYEEEAKASFDAWHEVPQLKSPSPFEKQISLIYTHEIFKKFQLEVLGAAACHLKKESENEAAATYSVKDFEDDQKYLVEWNESRSDILCSCRSFEYKGYLCRHAIVVLQMSGVFSIPTNYVLQRWTNAAKFRHGISENLDEVQSNIRRFNDLCRRAIILGEEGSLSQESYDLALLAIKEGLRQCAIKTNNIEDQTRSGEPTIQAGYPVQEENERGSASKEKATDPKPNNMSSAETRREKKGSQSNVLKKAKHVPQCGAVGAGSQEGFQQLASPRPLQVVIPGQFHNTIPSVFQNVIPAEFQNVRPTNIHSGNPSP
ncbi:PREDICTED: protein FAR1-RELATED SEQUENCE 4 isoform X2 [Tarenaya hassleriana]|uniref:protein FAR1-RELATED SEQUENCE 4 isoform X2 n=1 Tax=Tarenaya hassleriana TaxID=28532 RepID=UPI00053C1D02|nr:PREDICTED: protein FAR1-RELATED SEQUENCE 4 isoform X2 [Tarenaya hassleriana]